MGRYTVVIELGTQGSLQWVRQNMGKINDSNYNVPMTF